MSRWLLVAVLLAETVNVDQKSSFLLLADDQEAQSFEVIGGFTRRTVTGGINASGGIVKVSKSAGKAAIGLSWSSPEHIKEVRGYGYTFYGLKKGDLFPAEGRLYAVNEMTQSEDDIGRVKLVQVDGDMEKAMKVSPFKDSILVPISGNAGLSLTSKGGSLEVVKTRRNEQGDISAVQLCVYLPPSGAIQYTPTIDYFSEGDLIPIPPIIKTPPPQVNLRVHRIVAPDPAKHIPGWVELRFEPKDKPTPDKPATEKTTPDKPANNKRTSPETPSKTKPTNTKPKPK